MQYNSEKRILVKKRYDTRRETKDGTVIEIKSKVDTIFLSVLSCPKLHKTRNGYIEQILLTKTRDLIDMPCFLDVIHMNISRDFIDENLFEQFLYPIKRSTALKSWYHGDRLHIAVMGELLDQNSDISKQIIEVLRVVYDTAGVIPLTKRGYLDGILIQSKDYQQHIFKSNSNNDLFNHFLKAVSITNYEAAFGFHSNESIPKLIDTSIMFQDDPTHATYYAGKGGFCKKNGALIKRPIKAYDCAKKNNLKKPAPKIEMMITKERYPNLSLKDFSGTAVDIIEKHKRRIKKDFHRYLKVLNRKEIKNEYLLNLLPLNHHGIIKLGSQYFYQPICYLDRRFYQKSIYVELCAQVNSLKEISDTFCVYVDVLCKSKKLLSKYKKLVEKRLCSTICLTKVMIGNTYPGIPPPYI